MEVVGAVEQGLRMRSLRWFLRLLARLFFRSIEVVGSGNVPRDGGGLLVAWHPNGLADGILVLGFCPRPVTFGARHGLFRLPIIGWMLRGAGAVPLYRRRDRGEPGARMSDEERRAANHRSLGALAATARRSLVAIFPEGATHDEPGLLELRAGAARLFQLAQEDGGRPVLVPVGLHYERKHAFRSRALVAFYPPVELPEDLRAERRRPRGRRVSSAACGGSGSEDPRTQRSRSDAAAAGGTFVDRVTRLIQEHLIEVTHPTESWELHRAMERVRSLVRAERAAREGAPRLPRAPMQQRDAGFARVWAGYRKQRAIDPRVVDRLVLRVTRYGEALRLLGLSDRDLDGAPVWRTVWRTSLLCAEALVMLLLLPTVVLIGNLVNLPAALLIVLGARKLSATRKEQAGLKMFLGLIVLPTAWMAASLAVGLAWAEPLPGFDWRPEALWARVAGMLALCLLSALLGLRYHRFIAELRHGLRALWAGGFRRGTVERLRRRRSELYDEVIGLVAALDV